MRSRACALATAAAERETPGSCCEGPATSDAPSGLRDMIACAADIVAGAPREFADETVLRSALFGTEGTGLCATPPAPKRSVSSSSMSSTRSPEYRLVISSDGRACANSGPVQLAARIAFVSLPLMLL